MATAAERITRHYGGDWKGDSGTFPSPGHSPTDRGMSIKDGEGGDVLIHCFNDGDPLAVKEECRRLGLLPPLRTRTGEERQTGSYEYQAPDGAVLYRTRRVELSGRRKRFVAERPDGRGGWIAKLGDVRRVLYRSPELAGADPGEPVYLVEGERKADKLAGWGMIATACAFGAKGWRDEYAAQLSGRAVVILPDNDDEGRRFADKASASIARAGGRAVIVTVPRLVAKGADIMDWDGNADELRTLAAQALQPAANLRLPVELFGDIRPALDHRHLIADLIPTGAMVVMFGNPGSGKSFAALDMGLHIAAARDWMQRPVEPGGVVYVAAEGQGGLRLRIEAWRREHAPDCDIPFALIPVSLDLLDPTADLAKLADVMAALADKWGGVALLIIDTLAATFGGGDENGADMAAFVGNISRLCQPHGCTGLIVHHQPLNGDSKRPRGHGSLWGAADTVLHVEGEANAPVRRIRVTKQKDTSPGPDILFTLRQVEIGHGRDGQPVTSCIIDATGSPAPDRDPKALAIGKLPDGPKIALRLLDEATIAHGIAPPDDIPAEMLNRIRVGKVVAIGTWRDIVISAAGTDRDTNRDTAKRAFNRALNRLQADEIVRVFNNWAWRQW